MLANAESAQRQGNLHLAEGGLKIRLGDDSNAETTACKHLRFKVGEHAHDWDYHVMQLPRGIDLIVGMDFMKDNDVSLLCGTQKVMFGYSVLNAITLDPSELTTENYGPDALELDESDSQMKIDVPEIASIHSEKEDDRPPYIAKVNQNSVGNTLMPYRIGSSG